MPEWYRAAEVQIATDLFIGPALERERDGSMINCGSPNCRKIVTGRDWQRADLQEKYRGFFSWYLKARIR